MATAGANEAKAELADRIRALLAGENVEQRRMFGSYAFMVDDRMLVAAWGAGDLLVRVDPARSDELQRLPGVTIAEMGKGRSMGPSWLTVAASELDDDALLSWIDVAREFHAAQRP